MKTLIVEDDSTCAGLLNRILLAYGSCDIVPDGAEAIRRFAAASEEAEPYDLVCLDVMMPGLSGQVVLQRLRAFEAERGVTGAQRSAIIMTTSLSDASSISKAFRDECDGYLCKPIRRSDLLRELGSLGLIEQAKAPRVLIAEDDLTSRRMLEGTVKRWGYEPVTASNGEEAWEALRTDEMLQLAILDWMMPGLDGPEICQRVRALADHGEERYVYLVMLTGRTSQDDIIKGMEAGADDYIAKPFNPNELRVRLRAGQRIIELHDELLAAKRAFQIQAVTDSLTGVLNRRAVLERLQEEVARSRRDNSRVSVMFMDLDHFKAINDSLGHEAGDEVLQEFVRRLSGIVRRYDTSGRLGGEEFLVVVPERADSHAGEVAERVRSAVCEETFDTCGGATKVTVSIGVATLQDGEESEQLIRRADAAMYTAKDGGRNRVVVAS